MSDAKTFKCPSCGSTLMPDGDEKEVKCEYCGSTVIVPEELRDDETDDDLTDEEVAEQDYSAPSHLPWLVQHGVDATVKVDRVIPVGSFVQIDLMGKKADGGEFYGWMHYDVNPPFTAPRRGTMLKIKYNSAEDSDFAVQIDGQFYYHDM